MNAWLALSLSLTLGQMPTPSATADAPTEEQARRAVQQAEQEELRAQMELLRAQTEAQRQESQERLQSLEQQQGLEDARAQELERLRRQRLASLTRGYDWLITADRLLEAGNFDIGPAITSARQELSTALATAADTDSGEIARRIQSALQQLSIIEPLVAQRDIYPARRQLQSAGFELHRAWRLTLQREGATLVNQ